MPEPLPAPLFWATCNKLSLQSWARHRHAPQGANAAPAIVGAGKSNGVVAPRASAKGANARSPHGLPSAWACPRPLKCRSCTNFASGDAASASTSKPSAFRSLCRSLFLANRLKQVTLRFCPVVVATGFTWFLLGFPLAAGPLSSESLLPGLSQNVPLISVPPSLQTISRPIEF